MRGIRLPAVMGIVNVTPDSFSDGGRFLDAGRAVEHGLTLAAAGADILDVGGESTRPGAEPVDEDTECRRVVPVIRRLAAEARIPVSVDTTKAAVAAAALEAGATVVNDISAGRFDPAMLAGLGRGRARLRCQPHPGPPGPPQQDSPHEGGLGGGDRVPRAAPGGGAGAGSPP